MRTPGGGFTKETRTEYEQRTQAAKKEELGGGLFYDAFDRSFNLCLQVSIQL